MLVFLSGKTVTIKNMEIFKTGKWNGHTFKDADLDEMAVNFKALKGSLVPKLKITHRKDQESLAGLASYGDITNIYAQGKDKRLFADIEGVPLEVATWIKERRFAERSIELYNKFDLDGKVYNKVISAVALLGHEIPAVAGMEPVKLNKEDSEFEQTEERAAVSFKLDDESIQFEIVEKVDKIEKPKEEKKMDFEKLIEMFNSLKKTVEKELQEKSENANAEDVEAFKVKIAEYETKIAELEKLKEDFEATKKSLEDIKKDNDELKKSNDDLSLNNKEIAVDSFIETNKVDGKILPAFEKEVKALLMSMTEEKEIKFEKEEGKEEDVSSFDLLQDLIGKLPNMVDFEEHSKNKDEKKELKKEITSGEFKISNTDLNDEAETYAEENKVPFADALIEVSKKFAAEGKAQGISKDE